MWCLDVRPVQSNVAASCVSCFACSLTRSLVNTPLPSPLTWSSIFGSSLSFKLSISRVTGVLALTSSHAKLGAVLVSPINAVFYAPLSPPYRTVQDGELLQIFVVGPYEVVFCAVCRRNYLNECLTRSTPYNGECVTMHQQFFSRALTGG